MKVINKGQGIKHVGSVTIAPNEYAEIDNSWASSIDCELQIIESEETPQEETPAKRGRPAKLKEAE